ncbi:hypothetical protein Pmani_016116 [Petrolisthes manimaculis]|uniref:Uncharacterized protein n=1 Tax=Petrolisthes manimaculis TaxID=1843537 RepID=A0AAE1PSH8_9EUCA|nr:hypothetical protein Pmani_016116 [Petrolisthes manimaculis]
MITTATITHTTNITFVTTIIIISVITHTTPVITTLNPTTKPLQPICSLIRKHTEGREGQLVSERLRGER